MTPEQIISAVTCTSILVFIGIALFSRKSKKEDQQSFFLNQNLSFPIVMASLMATQIGGGVLLGTADGAFKHGWGSLCFNAGVSLGLIAVGFLMAGFIRRHRAETTGELCEKCYGSSRMRRLVSLLSIIWLCGLLVAQLVGLRKLFVTLGVEESHIYSLVWAGLVIYTALGGFSAIVKIGVIQISLTVVLFLTLFFISTPMLIKQGVWHAEVQSNSSFFYLCRLWMAPFLTAFLDQEMVQRFTSSKSAKSARAAAICAGFAIFLFAVIPATFGISLVQSGVKVPANQNALILWLTEFYSPWGLIIGCYALIVAVLSTCDSLLCAIGSLVVLDFLSEYEEKESAFLKNWIPTLVILFVGFFAYFLSLTQNDVLSVIVESGSFFISIVFVPVVMTYSGRRISPQSGWAAMITGFLTLLILSLFHVDLPKELIAVSLSFISFSIFRKSTAIAFN